MLKYWKQNTSKLMHENVIYCRWFSLKCDVRLKQVQQINPENKMSTSRVKWCSELLRLEFQEHSEQSPTPRGGSSRCEGGRGVLVCSAGGRGRCLAAESTQQTCHLQQGVHAFSHPHVSVTDLLEERDGKFQQNRVRSSVSGWSEMFGVNLAWSGENWHVSSKIPKPPHLKATN